LGLKKVHVYSEAQKGSYSKRLGFQPHLCFSTRKVPRRRNCVDRSLQNIFATKKLCFLWGRSGEPPTAAGHERRRPTPPRLRMPLLVLGPAPFSFSSGPWLRSVPFWTREGRIDICVPFKPTEIRPYDARSHRKTRFPAGKRSRFL